MSNWVEARVAAQEQHYGKTEDIFASLPSALATRLILWWCVHNPTFVCATLKITAFFLHASIEEGTFCECPIGSPVAPTGEPGEILQAVRAHQGFRPSPQCYQEIVEKTLKKHQVRRLKSEPGIFLHETTNTLITVQASDVLFATPRQSMEYTYQLFEREMKLRRGLVISRDAWTPYLGRLYRRTEKGFEVKISEKFWQSVFDLVGLKAETSESKKAVATPFVMKAEYAAGRQLLVQESLRSFRTLAGKLARAGSERPELLYAAKELCRHTGDARQSDLTAAFI